VYIPKAFEVTDKNKLFQFISDNSFGILFSQTNNVPFATHLPFLFDEHSGENGVLFSHMAKGNPHWKGIHNQDVLVVFHGPHTFVSSIWYKEERVVPTWNYAAVHVYGTFIRIDDKNELKQVIRDTLDGYEPGSPILSRLDEEFFDGLLNAVVGFKIEIKKIEGKWKLNQNHSIERQQNVIDALKATDDPNSHEIARLMALNVQQLVSNDDL
jgi:transcriptional regulator